MLFPNSYACLIKPVFFTLPFIPTPVAFIMPRSVGLGRHITKPRKPAMAKSAVLSSRAAQASARRYCTSPICESRKPLRRTSPVLNMLNVATALNRLSVCAALSV